MNLKFISLVLFTLTTPSVMAAPVLQDFAYRQPLDTQPGFPIHELALPDHAYANILNADLSDLRVFDRSGGVVPHAICPAPSAAVSEPRLETFLPFPLLAGTRASTGDGGRIDLTTADGTVLTVTEGGAVVGGTPPQDGVSAYVIDLRSLQQPIRALRLDWQSRNSASETSVRITSSDDLAQWQTLMPSAILLKAGDGAQALQRARIPLPEGNYSFLHFERGELGPLPQINSVVVEIPTPSEPVPVNWVESQPQAADSQDKHPSFLFSTTRRAPMHTAEIRLPASNMALGVALQSRDDAAQGWQTRWSGEVFALSSDHAQREHTVIRFSTTHDRLWRLQVLRGAETLRDLSPQLLLGYRPAQLRFLAQGEAPYQLAYGSARVELVRPSCDSMLSHMSKEDREIATGQAITIGPPSSGNLNVLKPLPKPTPLRQMLLWGVLVAGALLVAAMALSLLRKLRQE
jgi:hypothetical protein